jgi:serine/threonine protein phosphatase 1
MLAPMDWLRRHRRRAADKPAPRVPPGSRVYAIGDIHGRADLLIDLHGAILADAESAPERRVIVYLGDYVDRGLQSRMVVDMLIGDPLPGFERVHLKGNHEAALLDFLDDASVGPGWVQYGGAATLMSYRASHPASDAAESAFAVSQRELAERLPPDHLAFFRNLSLSHEEADYFFVHAGVRPGVPLSEQSADDLIWIRNEFLDCKEAFERIVVHGHTITEEPDVRRNRIGIDTGAFATGRLTCLVLEGTERRFLFT